MEKDFEFEVTGIGDLLKRFNMTVPTNQREYSWIGDVQVKDLLQDITTALRNPNKSYFLGTIVLTKGADDNLEIADGQQRLATTTMIIAAIRDWFRKKGETIVVQGLDLEYLYNIDIDKREKLAKLTLNIDDNEFFKNKVLEAAHSKNDQKAVRRSHFLISQAFEEITKHFANIERSNGDNTSQVLKDWIKYLKYNARVVRLAVTNPESAFKMFETLNDRGLKTSQADLIKNHLFRISENRLQEAQKLWSSMKGAIETVADEEDITMYFLKTCTSIIAGVSSQKEVMKVVQEKAQNKTECITLLTQFEEFSKEYAAISNPNHHKWNEYDPDVRKSIQTIDLFGKIQISPLMVAVAKYFSKQDAAVAFKKMVSWAARFKLAGYTGGKLDSIFTSLAKKIYDREIKNDKQLKKEADLQMIGDSEFKSAFEVVRVNSAKLARYYLRSLETTARQELNPEFVPNDDLVINLEHIIPASPSEHWPNLDKADFEATYARIGNLALLQADKNSSIGNLPFKDKKPVYQKSSFLLTSQLGDPELISFGVEEVANRQKVLAELALKTWSL